MSGNKARWRVLIAVGGQTCRETAVAVCQAAPHLHALTVASPAALAPVLSQADLLLLDLPFLIQLEGAWEPWLASLRAQHPQLDLLFLRPPEEMQPVTLLRAGIGRWIDLPLNAEEFALTLTHLRPPLPSTNGAANGAVNISVSLPETAVVHDAFAALCGLMTPQRVFETTCRLAVELFNADHSGLVVFDENQARGEVVAEYPARGAVGQQIPVAGVEAEEKLLTQKQPLLLQSVAEAGSLGPVRETLQALDIESILIVPVLVNGIVFGSFSIDIIDQQRPFTPADIELAQLLAAQVAIALDKVQQLQETAVPADRLHALRQSSQALRDQETDQQTLLHTVISGALKLLDTRSGGIYEYDAASETLTLITSIGTWQPMTGTKLKKGEGAAGVLVAGDKQYIAIADYTEWPQRADVYAGKQFRASVLEVPLRHGDEIVGVLYVDDVPGRQFTAQDGQLLQLYADQAAGVLHSAEALQQRSERLARLKQITRASGEIMSQLGRTALTDILTLLAWHVSNILQAEACSVCVTGRKGFIRFAAGAGYRDVHDLIGRDFAVVQGVGTGLTGHIAASGELFNAHGEALAAHPAVKGGGNPHLSTGHCHALLAIPLHRERMDGRRDLLGLLRVDNKTDANGQLLLNRPFDEQDEWVLRLFADTAVMIIESANLVNRLHMQQDHFRRLLHSSPNAVIANDRDGNIWFFNEQAEEIVGITAREAIGRSVLSLYPTPEIARSIARALNAGNGRVVDHETTIRHQSGEIIPIRLSATWLYDAQGEIMGTVGYFEDLRIVRETRRRLEWLLTANNIVSQADSLRDGLQKLSETLVHLLTTRFCYILTINESREFLEIKAAAPMSRVKETNEAAWRDAYILLEEWPDLFGFLKNGGPTVLRAEDAWGDHALTELLKALHVQEPVASVLAIPLRVGKSIAGLLYLGDLHRWETNPFADEMMQLAVSIAEQTAVLIDRKLSEQARQRREQLLATLEETALHMRAEQEPARLWQEVVNLAVDLTGCDAGGIFIYKPELERLELRTVHALPDELIGRQIAADEGLVGSVLQQERVVHTNSYAQWRQPEPLLTSHQFETVVGVPLRQLDRVVAVLFVADRKRWHRVTRTDLDVLERFAAHAAVTIRTAELIGSEKRMYEQLAVLHRISDTILATDDLEKILHVVLTGVTAVFGLGYNRAAILLQDASGEYLEGRLGIGHFDIAAARRDWEEDVAQGLDNFESYLSLLHNAMPALTPVGEAVSALRVPWKEAPFSPFNQLLREKTYALLAPEAFSALPAPFIEAFAPSTTLVLAPLLVRDHAIGILIADNKFTNAPVTKESLELLLTLVNTAAIAIDKVELFTQTRVAQRRLHAFYEASNTLVSGQPPDEMLQAIVKQAREATEAYGVSLMLIDSFGNLQKTVFDMADPAFLPAPTIRPSGLSLQVVRTGEEMVMENIRPFLEYVNPRWHDFPIEAAVCLPLDLRERCIGVMWIFYEEQRRFGAAKLEALKLFVNHAAMAYDNARHIENLDQMRQAASALAAVASLDEMLQQIVITACRVLEADSAALWSYDQERDKFLLLESTGEFTNDILWQAFRNQEPDPDGSAVRVMTENWVGVSDVTDYAQNQFLSTERRALLAEIGIMAYQSVALKVGDEKLGVLYINYRHPHRFLERERNQARTFAMHAALSLKKAKLLDGLQKARNSARVVASLTAQGGLGNTMPAVIRGTRDALNCDAITIYVFDEHKGKLVNPPFSYGLRYEARVRMLTVVPPHSLVLKILRRDDMYIADHVPTDDLFKHSRFSRDEEIASLVALPLRANDDRVGVMFVNYRVSHRFTTEELENIELFANQAAVAIYDAQLLQREQQRARVLQVLYDTGRTISVLLNAQDILQHIVQQAWHVAGIQDQQVSYASVWRVVGGMEIELVATYPPEAADETQRRVGRTINLEQGKDGRIGVIGRALQQRKSILVQDVQHSPDYLETQQGTHSELAVPILRGDDLIGVINLEHPDLDAFDQENVRALELLAAQAAVAVQNASLYETAVRRANLLDAAAQVASHAITILNEKQLLREAVQLITNRLNFYHAAVFLLDDAAEYAVLRAASSDGGQKMLRAHYRLPVGPSGIVGLVAATGRPYLSANVTDDNRHLVNKYLPHTRAEMAFPLVARQKVIGVLDVQSQHAVTLNDEEASALQTMANQLANAIQNSRYYADAQKQAAIFEALYDAGKAIASSLDQETILTQIVEQAWRLTGADGPRARFSCLVRVEDEKMHFVATYPGHILADLQKTVGAIDLNDPVRSGVMGRAVKTRQPQLVGNIRHDDDYIAYDQETRSELAVPIIWGDEVIGVINVEHPSIDAFNLDDRNALELLAAQAAIADEQARSFEKLRSMYRELQRTHRMVRARTAVAWMGMASSIWQHEIVSHAQAILDLLQLIRQDLAQLPADDAPRIENQLHMLARLANKIRKKPMTLPLLSEEGMESVVVNELFRERVTQLWQNDPFRRAELEQVWELSEEISVRASAEWLRRAFDILVENAVEALTERPVQRITIRTQHVQDEVEIAVIDTGCGLPENIQDKIGIENIEKTEDAEGLGMGLLMCQMIVQAYGGKIEVGATSHDGTTMLIKLPVEKKES